MSFAAPFEEGAVYLNESEVGLQFNIIRTDVFVVTVFHFKTFWDNAELRKPYTFIKMPCVYIAFNNCIELQNLKPDSLCIFDTIKH